MKRELLACLRLDEVIALADRVDVRVHVQSSRKDLIEAILNSRRVALNEVVPVLSCVRRREVCRALGIEDRRAEGCVVGEVGGHR